MEFKNINEALDWMIEHPQEKVYDEYGNYSIYMGDSNMIESFWYTGDYEDDEGNFEPGVWDYDKYTPEEFLDAFEYFKLQTID